MMRRNVFSGQLNCERQALGLGGQSILGVVWALVLLLLVSPAQSQQPDAPMMGPQQTLQLQAAREVSMPAARTQYGELTIKDIEEIAFYSNIGPRMKINVEVYPQLPLPALEEITRLAASRQVAYQKLLACDDQALKDKAQELRKKYEDRVLVNYLVKNEIDDKMSSPSQEAIEEYYNTHIVEFTSDFSFRMRHLILLTYKTYVVAPGDTLEYIAQKVCGDPSKADQIRANIPSRPLRREEGKEFKPLVENEELLVPMSDEQAESVRQKLENILKEMDKGISFEDLARKYSESETKGEEVGPLPSGTKPILDTLVEMGKQTPVGGVSPIFRTKHGWQVIEVTQKTEAGVASLESLRPKIVEYLKAKERDDLTQGLLDKLYNNPQRKVFYDLFKNAETLTSATVVATVGDYELQWKDVEQAWRERKQPKDPETIDAVLRQYCRELQFALSRVYVKAVTDDPSSELSKTIQNMSMGMMGEVILEHEAALRSADAVNDQALLDFYNENKEKMFKVGEQVTFNTIEMRKTEGTDQQTLIDQMSEQLKGVTTPEQFAQLADKINAAIDGDKRPVAPVLDPMALSQVQPDIKAQLDTLQENQWSQPFTIGENRVVSVLLLKKFPESYKEFAQVKDMIQNALLQKAKRDNYVAIENEWVDAAGFEFLVKE